MPLGGRKIGKLSGMQPLVEYYAVNTDAQHLYRCDVGRRTDTDAFQYAWTRYLLFSTDSMLTSYSLDVLRLDTSEERIGQFQLDLNRWFASQSKGSQCKVHCFQEEEATILNIQRGSYLRTVARWKGDRIEIETFRPATEDLLVYSPEKSALTIKASLTKERESWGRPAPRWSVTSQALRYLAQLDSFPRPRVSLTSASSRWSSSRGFVTSFSSTPRRR